MRLHYCVKNAIQTEKINYKIMENNIILTVVIPAYNMEKYLTRCCQSLVIDENLDKIEVLIVNDGSKDDTLQIARKFEKEFGCFRVIDKENGNYGSCVNRGLSEAKGKFIKILDADDSFDKKNFNEFIKFLLDISSSPTQVDMVITDSLIVDESGNTKFCKRLNAEPGTIIPIADAVVDMIKSLTHHNLTYRTEIIRKMNYVQTEGISYTDQEWVFLPLLAVNHFIYYSKIIYIYLEGRAGQTVDINVFIKNFWMQIVIKKNMLDFYKKNGALYPAVNHDIVKIRLCESIGAIYSRYLMKNYKCLNIDELVQFDSYLKMEQPEFYGLSNEIKLNKILPFHYIQYWRSSIIKFKIVRVLYRIYRTIVIVYKKFMKVFSTRKL